MKNGMDQVIVDVYSSFHLPPDQIVCDPQAAEELARRVNALLVPAQEQGVGVISRRLLNLRRRGQDNGGLPRRWRRYDGRNNDN